MQTQEKHSQAAVLGLQHLLAMYSGSILVPIMIATALGYSAEQLTYLISTDIFMCGVATFLQLQLNKYFGIGLPVVLGVAFQSVAPLIMIGQSHGSGAMFGALIVSGIYVVLISGIFSKVANLFPSIVTGSVITTIGLTLIPVAIGNMGNNVPEPTGQSLLLAAITVLIILLINIFTKGFIKSISILIGLVVGTAIAATVPFQKDDVLILHSVSGRNSIIIDMALYAKELGVKIIALTNVTYSKSTDSRHSSGKRLFELADIVIDNHGTIGDATCEIRGIEQKVGASSTVIGATVLNTIIVEVCQKLVDSGIKTPPIFYSANLDGGDELNKQLIQEYQDAIHYNF